MPGIFKLQNLVFFVKAPQFAQFIIKLLTNNFENLRSRFVHRGSGHQNLRNFGLNQVILFATYNQI